MSRGVPLRMWRHFCANRDAEACAPDLMVNPDLVHVRGLIVVNRTVEVRFLCDDAALAHGFVSASRILMPGSVFELLDGDAAVLVLSHPLSAARLANPLWSSDEFNELVDSGGQIDGDIEDLPGDAYPDDFCV
jgi:hypothetical protein